MNHSVELLAPAGSWEALTAVLAAGADAVYLSEKRFAMRQHGAWLHFEEEDLPRAVETVHAAGKKIHIAVNNLQSDLELDLLARSLPRLATWQPDAFIVQDLGLIRLLGELDLGIPIHASTMMNLHHPLAARFLKEHGVTRIIASRDITLAEAARLGRETGLEVEVFLHGDMCVAMGGQCFHSGLALGYSANRGKCLKSCRWPWSLVSRESGRIQGHVAEQYLLARKDLCLFHQIPRLLTLGIHSLKIEGRARPGEYLAPIVSLYRQALDRYLADPDGYVTDFSSLNHLRKHTLREVNTGHAFARPGPGSSGLSGEREPRFFSIAIEEPPPGQFQSAPIAARDSSRPELAVRVASPRAAMAMAETGCHWIYLGGERFMSRSGEEQSQAATEEAIDYCQSRGKKVGYSTPRISGDREFQELERRLTGLAHCPPDELLVHNPGMLSFLRGKSDLPLHADYSFNVWNGRAVGLLARAGVGVVTPGLELNLAALQKLAATSSLPLEGVVHGSLPGMILEYCPLGVHLTNTTSEDPCPGPCRGKTFDLVDAIGIHHPLEADQYCRNHLFMAKDLCTLDFVQGFRSPGIARVRIEGLLYSEEHLREVVEAYLLAMDGAWSGSERLEASAPRPWSAQAFAHPEEAVSEPCRELPTNWIVRYGQE